jgi:N-acetyl-gamma-glutamylphosphate reductase
LPPTIAIESRLIVSRRPADHQVQAWSKRMWISGAGRTPKPAFHIPESNENLVADSVGRHRHAPEIDQVLTEVGKTSGGSAPVEVIVTPHLASIDRGIHASIYAVPTVPPLARRKVTPNRFQNRT